MFSARASTGYYLERVVARGATASTWRQPTRSGRNSRGANEFRVFSNFACWSAAQAWVGVCQLGTLAALFPTNFSQVRAHDGVEAPRGAPFRKKIPPKRSSFCTRQDENGLNYRRSFFFLTLSDFQLLSTASGRLLNLDDSAN